MQPRDIQRRDSNGPMSSSFHRRGGERQERDAGVMEEERQEAAIFDESRSEVRGLGHKGGEKADLHSKSLH